MNDAEDGRKNQIEEMPTEQVLASIKQNQQEMNMLLEQLSIRASVQEYTELEYNELITLLEEALAFLEELSPLPMEWVGRRNELLSKIRKKL